MARSAAIALLWGVTGATALLTSLRVCTSTACRKDGAADTLAMLRALAGTAAPEQGGLAASALQDTFAASKVESCGCLGLCGSGPNVQAGDDEFVYRNVYKPKSAVALLSEELSLDVPEAAAKAWLNKMYADRARRANNPKEAAALLTEALNTAGSLRERGAALLRLLLEERADVHEMMRDTAAAAADRGRAEQMLTLKCKQAVAQD